MSKFFTGNLQHTRNLHSVAIIKIYCLSSDNNNTLSIWIAPPPPPPPKIRPTGLAAANAVGDKLPMLVIGNSAKPRCFQNVKNRSKKKSWIDGELLINWVSKLDGKFVAQDRQIALIIDNCPAHPDITGLEMINLIFLPPNTTSKNQPMDQGVIRSLKAHYRAILVRKQNVNIQMRGELPKITILEVMNILREVWDKVTKETIVNCFQKVGISSEVEDYAENDLDDPFKVLEGALQDRNAQHHDLLPSDVTTENFVDFDVDVSVTLPTPSTDEEILQAVRSEERICDDEDRENEVEEEETAAQPKNTAVQNALDLFIDLLLRGSMFSDPLGEEVREKCLKLFKIVWSSRKQTKKL